MSESFWFLTGDESPESDAERPNLSGTPFDTLDAYTPFQESMRGDRNRPQRAPSTDQKKIRRQIHRSGAHAFEEVDWHSLHPHLKDMADDGELHRGIGVNLPDELHDFVHDPSKPVHERATALLNHLVGQREGGDHRYGLGMHWSLDKDLAEDFGHKVAEHLAEENQRQGNTDFRYGRTPGETHTDYDDIAQHLHEHHGIHPGDQPDEEKLTGLHQHLHSPEPQMKGQQELFDASPYRDTRHLTMGPQVSREPDTPHAKPGTSVVFHTPIPAIEDIEHDPYSSSSRGGEVYHPEGHGEREVPIRSGASLPITGISWNHIRPWDEEEEGHDPFTYTHHRFDQPEYREAALHRSGSVWDTEGIAPHERVTDWDEVVGDHDTGDWRIHRTIHIDPMDDSDGFNLWKGMGTNPAKGTEALSDHEVAHRLLKLVTAHPHLGLHWTADENHAYRVGGAKGWGLGKSWFSRQDVHPEHSGLESPVIVHARWPKTEHIETDPHVLHQFGVKPFDNPDLDEHDEAEVPVKTGAPVEITGLSWSQHTSNRPGEYRHYTFDKPVRHHGMYATATVLNTQVERLNKGDQIRTPTGQTSEVKRLRPHETDSTLMYLDTDMGTSTVKRGTDFQVVPRNSQQQELPDTGNPMGGNFFELPGAGKTPGGSGTGSAAPPSVCPNCGNTGTFHLQGSNFICAVCGFTSPAGGSPGNLMFTNQPSGHLPARRKPGEVPRAHVWASKYNTFDQDSQIARRARRVAGGDQ